MTVTPDADELLTAVETFLREKALPELQGHTQFHARVAANVLAILKREAELGPQAVAEETARLRDLLQRHGSAEELRQSLCDQIKSGDMTLETKGLANHLLRTTIDQVKVDQPKYSGLKVAREKFALKD